MTAQEFNALPLPARRYIEQQKGCASCGNSQSIDDLYKKYLIMQKQALFTLRLGAVLYKTQDGESGILYPIHPQDDDEAVKAKISTALKVYAVAPNRFAQINEAEIKSILSGSEAAEAEADAAPEAKPLFGAAKKAAEKKAAAAAKGDDLV